MERCGPRVAISPVVLQSSNALRCLGASSALRLLPATGHADTVRTLSL